MHDYKDVRTSSLCALIVHLTILCDNAEMIFFDETVVEFDYCRMIKLDNDVNKSPLINCIVSTTDL